MTTLIILMIEKNYQPCTYYLDDVYRSVCTLLNEPLAQLILSKVKSEDLQAGMLQILLADFFTHNIDEAKAFAISLIPPSVPLNNPHHPSF